MGGGAIIRGTPQADSGQFQAGGPFWEYTVVAAGVSVQLRVVL